MKPHAPDIELTMAAGLYLLAPRDGAARLRAAVLNLEGVQMRPELRALWEQGARRLTGQVDDTALSDALRAFCEAHRTQHSRAEAAAFRAGATHAHHSSTEDTAWT